MTVIGLKTGEVKLARHSPLWRSKFAAEKRRLLARLRSGAFIMEHIGSTAVPGLDAKPILDIAIRIRSFRTLSRWIREMEDAGYVYKGEYGLPGRHFFTRGNPVTHHLHLVTPETPHWGDWLLLRDYLRASPPAARLYNETKRQLAKRFSSNRDAYTRAKTPLVRKLMRAARRWQDALNKKPKKILH